MPGCERMMQRVARILPVVRSKPGFTAVTVAFSRVFRNSSRTMASEAEVTLFDKIVSKEIPATVVYEDELALAFRDINACAPTHILIIPKNRDGLDRLALVCIRSFCSTGSYLCQASERHKELLGHLMLVASKVAKQEKLDDGYRVVVNDGPYGGWSCSQVIPCINAAFIQGKQFSIYIYILSAENSSDGRQVLTTHQNPHN